MERIPLASKTLHSAGYDPATQTLELEFRHSGRVYHYFDVPEGVFAWLQQVPSKTAYFNRTIRDVYRFRDVTPPPPGPDGGKAPPLLEQLRASLEATRTKRQ